MQSVTRFRWGATSLAVLLVAQAYGQQMQSNNAGGQNSGAQARSNGPSNVGGGDRPMQPIYENSAARSGGQDMSMRGGQADHSMIGGQRDNGPDRSSANGQQRGEIGVW